MYKVSGAGEAIMKRTGISFVDVTGKLRPLEDIIEDVGDASLNTGEMQELFGKQGARAMAALAAQGGGALTKFTDEIKNSDGAAKAMAETMQDNVEGAITKFNSALEGLRIALFEGTNPALQELIEWGAKIISDATKWVEAFKSNKLEMEKWKKQLILVKDLFKLLWELIENGVQGAWNSINLLAQGAQGLVQVMTGDWTEGVKTIKDAWTDFKEDTEENNKELTAAFVKVHESNTKAALASNAAQRTDEDKRIEDSIAANEEFLRKMGIDSSGTPLETGIQGNLKKGTSATQVAITAKAKEELGTRQENHRLAALAIEIEEDRHKKVMIEKRGAMLQATLDDYDKMVDGVKDDHDQLVDDLETTGTELGEEWKETNLELGTFSEEGGKEASIKFGDGYLVNARKSFGLIGGRTGLKLFDGFKGKISNLLSPEGPLGGLAGIFSSALPVVAGIQLGIQLAGPIWDGMKRVFSQAKNFFKNLFGGIWGGIKSIFGFGGGDKKQDPIGVRGGIRSGEGLVDLGPNLMAGQTTTEDVVVSDDGTVYVAVGGSGGGGVSRNRGASGAVSAGPEPEVGKRMTREDIGAAGLAFLRQQVGASSTKKIIEQFFPDINTASKDMLTTLADRFSIMSERTGISLKAFLDQEASFMNEASREMFAGMISRIEEEKQKGNALIEQKVQQHIDEHNQKVDQQQAEHDQWVANQQEQHDTSMANESYFSDPTEGVRVQNEAAIFNLQMENINTLHTERMANIKKMSDAIDLLQAKINSINADESGIIEILQRRSYQGDQVIYDTGIQTTGAA